jgi:hypothetical protein
MRCRNIKVHFFNQSAMKVIEFEKYRELGREAAETSEEFGEALDSGTRETMEVVERRAKILKKIENVTGERFAVANDMSPNVAAFVTVDDAKPHIVESSLDDPNALKFAYHEVGHIRHLRKGVRKIAVKDNLKEDEYAALNEFMSEHGFDLDEVDLLEGFNEFDTTRQHGVNDNCGYNKKEVPAATLLEEMCRRDTGRSLLEAFKAGDMELFYELLSSMSAIIGLRKVFGLAA